MVASVASVVKTTDATVSAFGEVGDSDLQPEVVRALLEMDLVRPGLNDQPSAV